MKDDLEQQALEQAAAAERTLSVFKQLTESTPAEKDPAPAKRKPAAKKAAPAPAGTFKPAPKKKKETKNKRILLYTTERIDAALRAAKESTDPPTPVNEIINQILAAAFQIEDLN